MERLTLLAASRRLVVGAAISVAVVSCDNGPTSPTRPAITGTRGDLIPGSGQSYSGQDIFRGVLLGDGPVADLIPEIRQNAQISNLITDSASLSAYRRFEDELIAELTTEDSTFFDRFSTDMHSGDPVTVEAAEQRASLAAIDAAEPVNDFETAGGQNLESSSLGSGYGFVDPRSGR